MEFLKLALDEDKLPALLEFEQEVVGIRRRFLSVDERIALLEKLLENLQPGLAGLYGEPFLRGASLIILEMHQQGIVVWEQLLGDLEAIPATDSSLIPIAIHRAKVMLSCGYTYIGDFKKALFLLDETISNSSCDEQRKFLQSARLATLAQQHLLEGRQDEAIQSANESLEIRKNVEAYNWIGYAQRDLNRLSEAIEAFDLGLELSPDHPVLHSSRAVIFLERQEFESALSDISKAIELNPNTWEFYGLRARAYLGLGQTSSALEELVVAFQLNPEPNVGLLATRAEARKASGNLQDALDDIRLALSLDSKNGTLHRHLGTLLTNMGDVEAALKAFEVAVELMPRPEIGLLLRVGLTHFHLHHYSRSISPLRTASSALWEASKSVDVPHRCVLALALARSGYCEEPLAIVSETMDLAPDSQKVGLLDCLSLISIVQGDFERALVSCSSGLKLVGSSGNELPRILRFRKALILLREGRCEGLAEDLQQLFTTAESESDDDDDDDHLMSHYVSDLALVDSLRPGYLQEIETAIQSCPLSEFPQTLLICLLGGLVRLKECCQIVRDSTREEGCRCWWCGILTLSKKACSRCHMARYCSRECQRSDWKFHRSACSEAMKRAEGGGRGEE